MAGLHGVETIELTNGTVTVETISTAVIGLVGTAPDAADGVAATGTSGSYLTGTAVDYTAKAAGRSGNDITISGVAAAASGEATAAKISDNNIIVTLKISAAGAITATVSEVINAINSLADSPVKAETSPLVSTVNLTVAVDAFR